MRLKLQQHEGMLKSKNKQLTKGKIKIDGMQYHEVESTTQNSE